MVSFFISFSLSLSLNKNYGGSLYTNISFISFLFFLSQYFCSLFSLCPCLSNCLFSFFPYITASFLYFLSLFLFLVLSLSFSIHISFFFILFNIFFSLSGLSLFPYTLVKAGVRASYEIKISSNSPNFCQYLA